MHHRPPHLLRDAPPHRRIVVAHPPKVAPPLGQISNDATSMGPRLRGEDERDEVGIAGFAADPYPVSVPVIVGLMAARFEGGAEPAARLKDCDGSAAAW